MSRAPRMVSALLSAALAIAPAITLAQVIDFETIPGQGTPIDNQLISSEFEVAFGVTFQLLENDGTPADPAIGPRIAKIGGAKTAFVGPPKNPTCDTIGSTTNDTVHDLARSGCWILTDDGVHPGPRPFGLRVNYTTPVMQAGGELIDIDDGPEAWQITALDASGDPIVHAANPVNIAWGQYPGADDGLFATFVFDLGQPIFAIELIYTGEDSFGRGLAFDNFAPSTWPVGVGSEYEARSWGQTKAQHR